MQKWLLQIVTVSLLFLVYVTYSPKASAAEQRHYVAVAPIGEVYILKAGSLREILLLEGMKIEQGDRVKTTANSQLSVIAPDTKDELILSGNTVLYFHTLSQVKTARHTNIHVLNGDVYVYVTPIKQQGDTFKMMSQNVPIEVKGTHFVVSINDTTGNAFLQVLSGMVALYSGSNSATNLTIYPAQTVTLSPDIENHSIEDIVKNIPNSVIESLLKNIQQIQSENAKLFEQYVSSNEVDLNNINIEQYLNSMDTLLLSLIERARELNLVIDEESITSLRDQVTLSPEQKKAITDTLQDALNEKKKKATEEIELKRAQLLERQANLVEQKKKQLEANKNPVIPVTPPSTPPQETERDRLMKRIQEQLNTRTLLNDTVKTSHATLLSTYEQLHLYEQRLTELQTVQNDIEYIYEREEKLIIMTTEKPNVELPDLLDVDTNGSEEVLKNTSAQLDEQLLQLSHLETEIKEASDTLAARMNDYTSTYGTLAAVQTMLQNEREQLNTLRTELSNLHAEIESLLADEQRMQTEQTALQQAHGELIARQQTLERLYEEWQTLQSSAQTGYLYSAKPLLFTTELPHTLPSATAMRNRVREHVATLTQTVTQLQQTNVDLTEEINTFIATYGDEATLQENIERSKLEQRLAALEVQRQTLVAQLSADEQATVAAQQQLIQLQTLQTELETLEAETITIQTNIDTFDRDAAITALQDEIDALEQQQFAAERLLNFYMQKANEYDLTLPDPFRAALLNASTKTLAELQQEIEAAELAITQLQNASSTAVDAREQAVRALAAFVELHGDEADLTAKIAAAQQAIATLQQQYDTLLENDEDYMWLLEHKQSIAESKLLYETRVQAYRELFAQHNIVIDESEMDAP